MESRIKGLRAETRHKRRRCDTTRRLRARGACLLLQILLRYIDKHRTSIAPVKPSKSGMASFSSTRSMHSVDGIGAKQNSERQSSPSTFRIDPLSRYLTQRSRTQIRLARTRSLSNSTLTQTRRRMGRMAKKQVTPRTEGERPQRHAMSLSRCDSTFRAKSRRMQMARSTAVMLTTMTWRNKTPPKPSTRL
jgi:hypothetical protein